MFSDIVIQRVDSSGNVVQAIDVPLTYAPKDKMIQRILQDPLLDQEAAITLPRMSFVYHDARYNGNRKLNTIHRVVRKNEEDVNRFKYQYNPVPYDLRFSLYIYCKNAEDAARIIEQILPYFSPEWSAQVETIPEMNITTDVAVVMNEMNSEDRFDGQFTDRRTLIWTLDFTLQGNFYGPIKSKPIIKFANTRFFYGTLTANSDATDVSGNGYYIDEIDTVQVSPGLDANGDPTTKAAVSISPLLMDVDDDWDYVIEKAGVIIDFE